MQETKKTNLMQNMLLLFLVLLICLFFFEIGVRLFWYEEGAGYPEDLFLNDPELLGYKYKPNFSGTFTTPNYNDIEIKINSKGLRDDGHEYEKKDIPRILVLGDSVTFGAGVSFEDTYLKKLENKFNSNEKSVEIIKTGVGGYNLDQESAYYFAEGYKYDPDTVIYAFVPNDLLKLDLEKVRRNIEEYDFYTPLESPFEMGTKKICKSCILFYTLIFNYDDLYYQTIFSYWEDEERADYFEHELKKLNNKIKKEDKKFIVILFPFSPQFNNSQNYGYALQKKVTLLAEENNLTVIDLAPYLDVPNYQELFLPKDISHLSIKGNEIIAEALYAELINKDIL